MENLREYRHLLGSKDDILIFLSRDYKIIDILNANCDRTENLRKEYIGKDFNYFFSESNISKIINEIESGIKDGFRKSILLESPSDNNSKNKRVEIIYDNEILLLISSKADIIYKSCPSFYKQFFDISINGLIILNLDGEFVKVNQAFASIIGEESERLVGEKLIKYIHPKDYYKLYQINDLFLSSEDIKQYELRIRTSDLGYRVFEIHCFMKDDLMFVVARDISDKKALNEMLLNSKLNYENMFNSMDDFLVIAYLDGQIIYGNSAYYKKLGYKPVDLKAKNIIDLHPKKYKSKAKELLKEIKEGKRNECPIPLVSKEGKEWPVNTKIWFGQWNGEDVLYGLSKDLSKEQELLVRFNKVFQSNPSYMTIHDYKSEEIIDVNQSFINEFCFNKSEVIGKKISDLGFKGLLSINPLKDYIKDFEGQIQRRYYYNNRRLDILHSVELIESNRRKYILSVMIDITEPSRIKEELEKISQVQDLLMKFSTDFINIPLDKVESAIDSALALMGRFISADRVYIFEYDFEEGITSNTHEWCGKYASKQIHKLQDIPLKPFQGWVNTHKKGNVIHIKDVSKLDDANPIKEVLLAQNIKSILTVPMILDGQCIGFAGFDTTIDYREYSDPEVRLMTLFAQMLVNVLNRKQQEDLLYSKIEERELLIKEIHHRVKNNLQIISSFLYLQSQYSSNQHVKEILNTTNNRIKAMAILHEKIYRGDSLNKFSFKSYLEEINRQLFNHYVHNQDIELILNIEDIDISLNRAIPIGLIVNELVTNAIQHAFVDRESGELTVEVISKNSDVTIVIKDNGVGYDIENYDKESSLGLVIVDSLISQLDGSYEVLTDSGTTYSIQFSKENLT